VTGGDDTAVNRLKEDGYMRALRESGVTVNESFILYGDYSYQSGVDAAAELLALPDKPTAVFVASDEMALGVIHGAQAKGYNIPHDLEVFGFDNMRLATMVQPMYDIGAVAMRLLTKYMNKEEDTEKNVILPHRIIERSSTNDE